MLYFISVIKKNREKKKKISGLNTILHLAPIKSLLWVPGKEAKEMKSWIFHKAATDPSAGISLTHRFTNRHLPGLFLVRARGSQLPLSLCCTWYWQLNSPWDPGPTEVFGQEDYRDVCGLLFPFKCLYKNKVTEGFCKPSHDETSHQGGGKGFHHPQHLGSASTFGIAAYQSRSAVKTPQDFVDVSDSRKNMKTLI